MELEFKEETAPNINELKKMAATKTDANLRLKAVKELGNWKCQQSKDILWRLMMQDKVYEVKHAAFIKLQSFGEVVKLPRKSKGNLIMDINNKIKKVVTGIDGEVSFDEFKEIFKQKLPEAFDVYKHENGNGFDTWLRNVINNYSLDIKSKILNID